MPIPEGAQIAVKQGDFIFIHYDEETGVLINERYGSGAEVCCGLTFDLLDRNYNIPATDHQLRVGGDIPSEMLSYRRMLSFNYIVGNAARVMLKRTTVS